MLPRSSQTNRTSTIPKPGSIHTLQEYVADVTQPRKDFPEIDEEGGGANGEQSSSAQIASSAQENGEFDFRELVANKDFSELFRQFFVIGHKELIFLQSKILLDRDIDPNTLLQVSEENAPKIQEFRKQLYRLQVSLFKNPKGRQYDAAQ